MATVVVPLTILMAFEDGTINKVRPKVSFISNISSSCMVVINTMLVLPARKVILRGTDKKSLPSTPLNKYYKVLVWKTSMYFVYVHARVYVFKLIM